MARVKNVSASIFRVKLCHFLLYHTQQPTSIVCEYHTSNILRMSHEECIIIKHECQRNHESCLHSSHQFVPICGNTEELKISLSKNPITRHAMQNHRSSNTLHLPITRRLQRPPQDLDRIRRNQTHRRHDRKPPPKSHSHQIT